MRTSAKPFHRWDGFDEWNKKTRVVYLGAQDLGYQRQPALIWEQMVFAAELATISEISTRMLATRRGGYAGSVNASSIPHDLVVLAQPSRECLVDALPDASFRPFMEPAPTSHATAAAAAEFTRQIFPWYSSFKSKGGFLRSRLCLELADCSSLLKPVYGVRFSIFRCVCRESSSRARVRHRLWRTFPTNGCCRAHRQAAFHRRFSMRPAHARQRHRGMRERRPGLSPL